jgi:hypothetical protein
VPAGAALENLRADHLGEQCRAGTADDGENQVCD